MFYNSIPFRTSPCPWRTQQIYSAPWPTFAAAWLRTRKFYSLIFHDKKIHISWGRQHIINNLPSSSSLYTIFLDVRLPDLSRFPSTFIPPVWNFNPCCKPLHWANHLLSQCWSTEHSILIVFSTHRAISLLLRSMLKSFGFHNVKQLAITISRRIIMIILVQVTRDGPRFNPVKCAWKACPMNFSPYVISLAVNYTIVWKSTCIFLSLQRSSAQKVQCF